jgi:hypothetical protein
MGALSPHTTKENRMIEINNRQRWGLAAEFISPMSADPLWLQVHKNYQHGGGWNDIGGFEVLAGSFDEPFELKFSGDPVYHEEARIRNHTTNEVLALFRYSFMLWTDGSDTKIARID